MRYELSPSYRQPFAIRAAFVGQSPFRPTQEGAASPAHSDAAPQWEREFVASLPSVMQRGAFARIPAGRKVLGQYVARRNPAFKYTKDDERRHLYYLGSEVESWKRGMFVQNVLMRPEILGIMFGLTYPLLPISATTKFATAGILGLGWAYAPEDSWFRRFSIGASLTTATVTALRALPTMKKILDVATWPFRKLYQVGVDFPPAAKRVIRSQVYGAPMLRLPF
jgi:hypothetical protein